MADFESIWQDDGFEDWDDYEAYSEHRRDNPEAMPVSVWVEGVHARVSWEVEREERRSKREYWQTRRQRAKELARARRQRAIELARAAGNPSCPKCGDVMVSRLARRGFNAGKHFWGCSSFPRCWGSRSM